MTHPLSGQLRQSASQARTLNSINSPSLLIRAADELDRLYDVATAGKADAALLENEKLKEELLNLAAMTAEYEPVLRLIATGPRPDGTYNYCREACQQLAQKALSHD